MTALAAIAQPPPTERARRAGYAAAVAGMDLDQNPFPCGAMNAAWIDGWREAVAESLPVGEEVCPDCRAPYIADGAGRVCRCQPGE
jgi:ribosome modulation factor